MQQSMAGMNETEKGWEALDYSINVGDMLEPHRKTKQQSLISPRQWARFIEIKSRKISWLVI